MSEAEDKPGRHYKIRERAYALWLDQGMVHGRDQEHWREAEIEIENEGRTGSPKKGASKSSPKNAARDKKKVG